MSDAQVEAFGSEWRKVIATFRRIETGDASVRISVLHRTLASAEKAFVLAYARMDSAVAARFRALILQARKLDESSLATEARRFASQMEDAWLLLEVDRGVAAPIPAPARESSSSKPNLSAPTQPAASLAPTRADTFYSGHRGDDLQPVVAARRRPGRLRLRGRWFDQVWFQMLGGVAIGLLVVAAIALLAEAMRTPVPDQQATAVDAPAPTTRRSRTTGGATVATDGPFVTTSYREPTPLLSAAARFDPYAFLTWMESEYGRAPDGLGRLSDLSRALCSADAHWRISGKAGALADELTLAGSLAIYGESAHLLPGEVLHGQGGSARALALTYVMLAWRVGLEPSGVWLAEGRTAAVIDDSFCFGASPRTSPVRATETIRDAVLSLAFAVAEREAAAAVIKLRPLLDHLTSIGAPSGRVAAIHTRWLDAIASTITTRDADALSSLIEEVPEIAQHPLSTPSLQHLCTVMLSDSIPLAILRACVNQSPEFRLADGSLVAEVLISRLHSDPVASKPPLADLSDQLLSGLTAAPDRVASVAKLLADLGQAAHARQLGTNLWNRGTRTWNVAALAMADALATESAGPPLAVAIGAQLLLADAAPPPPSLNPVMITAPPAAHHLLSLLLSIHDTLLARRIAAAALQRWPKDATVWRLAAEVFAETNSRDRAVALLSQLVAAHPADQAALTRLEELTENE